MTRVLAFTLLASVLGTPAVWAQRNLNLDYSAAASYQDAAMALPDPMVDYEWPWEGTGTAAGQRLLASLCASAVEAQADDRDSVTVFRRHLVARINNYQQWFFDTSDNEVEANRSIHDMLRSESLPNYERLVAIIAETGIAETCEPLADHWTTLDWHADDPEATAADLTLMCSLLTQLSDASVIPPEHMMRTWSVESVKIMTSTTVVDLFKALGTADSDVRYTSFQEAARRHDPDWECVLLRRMWPTEQEMEAAHRMMCTTADQLLSEGFSDDDAALTELARRVEEQSDIWGLTDKITNMIGSPPSHRESDWQWLAETWPVFRTAECTGLSQMLAGDGQP